MVDLNFQNMINTDEGGQLVQEGYSAQVLDMVTSKSVCEPYLNTWPMQHKVENVNTITQGATAYFLTEAQKKKKSTIKFGNFKMELQEIATMVIFTEDWVKFATLKTGALIQKAIVDSITKLIDQAYLGYEPTSPYPASISGDIPVGNIISTGADFLIKLSNAMGKVEDADFEPNGIAAPLSLKATLRNMRDLNGQPIFQPATATEPASCYGLPIRFSSNMIAVGSPAAKELIVGDWNQAYKGDDQSIEFKYFDQCTVTMNDGTLYNLPENDMVAVRAKVYKAFNVFKPSAFAKILL